MSETMMQGTPESGGTGKRKVRKRTFVACLLVLVAGVMLLVGGVLAYLTDTDVTVNTFTFGEVTIDTLEPNWPGNGSDEVKDQVPLQETPKDPQIKNSGKNRAIVYEQVDIPMAKVITANDDGFKNELKNRELFEWRTEKGDYNSIGEHWVLLSLKYIDSDGNETSESSAAFARRLYGYELQLEENEITNPLFEVVRLINVIEDQIDNTTASMTITTYGIQADNIASLTDAHYDDVMDASILADIYNVYMAQSGDKIPEDADFSNESTLINTTLNVTMTVANTHLKLNTGDVSDTHTATDVKVAYTGKGETPVVTYTSSNPNVATVDESGNIVAKSVGNTIITASAVNPDTGKIAAATVTITVRDVNAGE